MRIWLLPISVFLMACGGGDSQEPDGSTEDLGQVTDTVAVSYDLDDQAEIVKDFFKLTPDQITEHYCYSEADVKELILGDDQDDPDRYLNGFDSWRATDNYLVFDNNECYSTFEFKTFYRGDRKQALLLISDKGYQEFKFFEFAVDQDSWVQKKYFPKPNHKDYFEELTDEEEDIVLFHGVDFLMTDEKEANFTYYFSTWQTGMNAGEESEHFEKDPDYEFVVKWDNKGYWLSKRWETKEDQPNRYLMAYSDDGDYDQEFKDFANELANGSWLKGYNFEYVFADFSKTNYHAFFKSDTFDLRHHQQFEARNGYWVYQEGQEPLDLEMDLPEYVYTVIQRYFDQADEQ